MVSWREEGREKGGRTEREVESAGERNLFNDVFFCPVVAAAGASQFGGQLRLVQTRLGVGGEKIASKSHVLAFVSKNGGGAGTEGKMLGKGRQRQPRRHSQRGKAGR